MHVAYCLWDAISNFLFFNVKIFVIDDLFFNFQFVHFADGLFFLSVKEKSLNRTKSETFFLRSAMS